MAGEETEEGEEIGADGQTMETMATCKQVDDEEVIEEEKIRIGESFGLKRRRRWRKMLSPKKRMKAMKDLEGKLGRGKLIFNPGRRMTTEKEIFGKRIETGNQKKVFRLHFHSKYFAYCFIM